MPNNINEDNSNEIYSERILISNNSNNQSRFFDNVTLTDLKLIGQYQVIINSTGKLATYQARIHNTNTLAYRSHLNPI